MSDETRVIVSLVVNGDHGMPTGYVEKADFSLDNDTVLQLESQWWYDEEEDADGSCPHPRFEYDEARRFISIDGHTYQVLGHSYHVGNIFWDGFLMTLRSARSLAKRLLQLGWQPDEWSEDGPFALASLKSAKSVRGETSEVKT